VLDVYRNRTYTKITDRSGATGPNNYNREHTWPNSLGFNDLDGLDANAAVGFKALLETLVSEPARQPPPTRPPATA